MTDPNSLNAEDNATKHLGDGIRTAEDNNADAAGEYYRLQTMKFKMDNTDNEDMKATYSAILKHTDELEVIRAQVLAKILNISSSSPEAAQLYDLTHTRNKYRQADFIAETIYDKQRAELIFSFYSPDKDIVRKQFINRTKASAAVRNQALDEIDAKVSAKTSVAAYIARSAKKVVRAASGSAPGAAAPWV
jgi:hypothetical protein